MQSVWVVSVLLAACLLSAVDAANTTSTSASMCGTGTTEPRTKVVCDNKDYACDRNKARTYKLTCGTVEDQPGMWSTYKYACCPQEKHPDSACAAGLCAGGEVNRDGIICDNKKEGSPCGSDQHAELVLTCGIIHDQISWGQRVPCAQAATDYSTAHPHCCGASMCGTGTTEPRTKVVCDNKDYACDRNKARTYKLTCGDVEDQPGMWSTYKYACCPQEKHPDSACAAGLCAGGEVNRDGIICDNKKEGSPCGSDQHAELVLTCGIIHDQISWGQRVPCAQAATDYSTAHPHCCGAGTRAHTASLSAIVALTAFIVLKTMSIVD